MTAKDWRGVRLGMLTVTDRAPKEKDSYARWRCRCDCGGEIILDSRALKRGSIQDCGCRNLGPNQRDLTGQRFGKLTCLASTGKSSRGNGTIWRCRCDCGKECELPSRYLTGGIYKSCGCLSHPQRPDLTGQRFGRLTAVRYVGKIKGGHRWECKCDCGSVLPRVRQDELLSGRTTSCGCLGRERREKTMQFHDGTSIHVWKRILEKKPGATNQSGFTGVYFSKQSHKWAAQITFKGRKYHLGTFENKADAIRARIRANEKVEQFIAAYEKQPAGGPTAPDFSEDDST